MIKRTKKNITLLGLMTLLGVPFSAMAQSLTEYVEPRIGTAHCRWFHFSPGAFPFGMAKPAPATNAHLGNNSGWEATGYDYRENSIEGFPLVHEFQVGGIVLMASNGALQTIPGAIDDVNSGYRSSFDRADEVATAGYYSVLLKDYGIQAELTATPRVAFTRFTFPAADSSRILFDIGNRQGESGAVKDAFVQLNAKGDIEGWVITEPEYVKKYQPGATVPIYFYAEVDKAPASVGAFNGATATAGAKKAHGKGAVLYLNYATTGAESVTVTLGLSYTTVVNAPLNLATAAAHLGFD